MDIIRLNKNDELKLIDKAAVAIGQFDGLHIGHLKLIKSMQKTAEKQNLKSAIITFDPHPDYVLGKRKNDGYITPLVEKIKILEDLKIDYKIVISFDKELSQMEPQIFYNRFLSTFDAILVGSDFRFGYRGKGNVDLLKANGKEVIAVGLEKHDDEKIGSNWVRKLISEGRVSELSKLLGRNYIISGVVNEGSKIGRTLGFKTANVELKEEYQIIKKGVYAVLVNILNKQYLGVCNIGNNPSINYIEKMRLEVHILDFEKDIYGQDISIEFLERIRDEFKFEKIDDLIKQIEKDIEYVRENFAL